MTQISNVAHRWPILRIAADVTLVFGCSAPVVWLLSNFLVNHASILSLGIQQVGWPYCRTVASN